MGRKRREVPLLSGPEPSVMTDKYCNFLNMVVPTAGSRNTCTGNGQCTGQNCSAASSTYLNIHVANRHLTARDYYALYPGPPVAAIIEMGQRVNTPWLSECCQAVNKLSTRCQEKKYFFAQTHFLELTNQNTNIHTKIPK